MKHYPESADIGAITKQVNERLAELTDFGLGKLEIFTWLLKKWLGWAESGRVL